MISVPVPSVPDKLLPQAHKVPSDLIANAVLPVPATLSASKPVICTGVVTGIVPTAPNPINPLVLSPTFQIVPFCSLKLVVEERTVMSATDILSKKLTRANDVNLFTLPIASCPRTLFPVAQIFDELSK